MHIFRQFANANNGEGNMKEVWMIVGFGAGLLTGALLYKHSQEAKQLVNKGEKAVKKEMDNFKEVVKSKTSKPQKQAKSQN